MGSLALFRRGDLGFLLWAGVHSPKLPGAAHSPSSFATPPIRVLWSGRRIRLPAIASQSSGSFKTDQTGSHLNRRLNGYKG
jgi:hypothetical protein